MCDTKFSNSQLREPALHKAVSACRPSASNSEILEGAKLFYEFLKGDTEDQDDTAPGST